MRIRKCLALGGAITIFLGCIIIYRMADYTLYLQEESVQQSVHMSPGFKPVYRNKGYFMKNMYKSNHIEALTSKNMCKKLQYNYSVDIEMAEVYKEIKFDNIDGGVWKQGWNIEINQSRWNGKNKLKVFIVPHSHNDPGWLKTFDDYYRSETRNILNNMLKKLTIDSKKKFIWAEISFFALWWDELSPRDQEKVKRLIQKKQLEIVTGGWVMNDEANTHYYSMVTQLTEGHQWMKTNIQVQPKNGWTIDPFGESPVMAYILKNMGIEHLVIQRVHYSIKKYFAELKNLEFRWRQIWDDEGIHDVLTHMTPFYSYDIPHTCGPNPKICCQFDFKRLPGNGLSCPWRVPPKIITDKNVALRAQMLLDQYRKKAELYRTNVLLVPLGDDFRYQHPIEWDNQFENYYKLLNYINSNRDLHAEIKFGTLADFFTALNNESTSESFPTLVGDFFTYADRDDHYWSGYYTSRPFYKKMDRNLIGYHRAAEILYSLGWGVNGFKNPKWFLAPHTGFAKTLRDARRSLSLFQHHDGITGTARDNVMEDYAQKMLEAINSLQHVIQQVSNYLITPSTLPYIENSEKKYFEFENQQNYLNAPSNRKVFVFTDSKTIVLFNSLTYKRKELISILVFTPFIEIRDHEDNLIVSQTVPFFSQDAAIDETRFEVFFVAEVPALGLTSYKISVANSNNVNLKNSLSKIKIFNSFDSMGKYYKGFENIEISDRNEFSIENQRITVNISEKGFLKSITYKDTKEVLPLHLDFISYFARKTKETSGAYLFLPDGEATIVKEENLPLVRLLQGPLFTKVEVKLKSINHFLFLHNIPELDSMGIEIFNLVDISGESNYELGMRVASHLKSGRDFYTDLNGFQMIKRTRYEKLPIQGNFYPMPSAAYIEDSGFRITVLSGQPLGVSSRQEGQLEVLLDRRLKQDDNRGLGQGILDNRITSNIFRLLVEKRITNCQTNSISLSINAYRSSQSLLNPFVKMVRVNEKQPKILGQYSPVANDLGVDVHLLSVRTFDEEEVKPSAGFVFQRTNVDICFSHSSTLSNGIINFDLFLPNHFGNIVKKTSLSFLREENSVDRKEDLLLCHMNFLSILLS